MSVTLRVMLAGFALVAAAGLHSGVAARQVGKPVSGSFVVARVTDQAEPLVYRCSDETTLLRPELLADSIDEELDAAAARAQIDVELLFVHEQLAQFAKHAPVRPLVKFPGPLVLERFVTARALHRI